MKTANAMRSFVGATLLSASAAVVQAVPMVSIDPATSFGTVGGSVFVDILWDGDGSNYIGDWDIDLTYDDTVVKYEGSSFHLGLDPFNCTLCGDEDSVAGTINLYEMSLASLVVLISNQNQKDNAFKLATLEFTGLTDGISPLIFGASTFGNQFGDGFTPTLANGRICIGNVNCTVSVPEPTTLSVFLLGLAGLVLRRRYGRRTEIA